MNNKINQFHPKYWLIIVSALFLSIPVMQIEAKEYKFIFNGRQKKGYTTISHETIYGKYSYGYDLNSDLEDNEPFFFSIDLPEGNYLVTVLLGNENDETNTTIRSESRRLMLENINTSAGNFAEHTFAVNTRNKMIGTTDSVRIKPREFGKLNWDNKLTLEINGENPGLVELIIRKANIPTLFLAGNSTVTDQDSEPWCGWGQILPRFLSSNIAVANYAESGEAGNSFISAKRFEKILSKMRKGDYLLIEFGHNDQKQKGEDKGPYKSYKNSLKYMIDHARKKGGFPILVTPMQRRKFDENGAIIQTLGEYPDAMKQLAKEENVPLVDLNSMSKTMYEAWGPELSKKAFVHYPANTFPGQTKPLADDTHFNSFGGFQICKCVLQGLIDIKSPLVKYIRKDFVSFDPAHPDDPNQFYVPPTPSISLEKPEGN